MKTVHPQINLPSGAVMDIAGGTKNGAFSEMHRIFVSRNGLEERRRKSANLILSNSICPSLTLKDPVCCNTTVALYKLPDPHNPLPLCQPSFLFSAVHSPFSRLCFQYDSSCVLCKVNCISAKRITGLISELSGWQKVRLIDSFRKQKSQI